MPVSIRLAAGGMLLAAGLILQGCPIPDRLLFRTPRPESRELPAGLPVFQVPFSSGESILHGWYVPGKPGRPLVLYFHGTGTHLFGEGEDIRLLRERLGVSVFAFDYQGFGESGGNPTVAGTYADARAALAWLRKKGWTPERTVYYGRSLGAAVALQLAVETAPAGVVLESAFTSLIDLIDWHHPVAGAWLSWILPDYYDNLEKVGDLRSPVFFIHGGNDAIVPPAMGMRLFMRAPAPKEFLLLPGGDHDAPREGEPERYWSAWKNFLAGCSADSGGVAKRR